MKRLITPQPVALKQITTRAKIACDLPCSVSFNERQKLLAFQLPAVDTLGTSYDVSARNSANNAF